jgi:hypothetical protein
MNMKNIKQADKKILAAWLDERDQIWRKYLEPLNAIEAFYGGTCTMEVLVPDAEGNVLPLYKREDVRDTDAARSLTVNRAYYTGAIDAFRFIGLNIHVYNGRHYVDGQEARS